MKIFKYELDSTNVGEQTIMLPMGAQILRFAVLVDTIYFWAQVDPDAPLTYRRFYTVMTGDEPPPNGRYLYTALMGDPVGTFVLHIFETSSTL